MTAKKALVVGSGVIGLRTALELLRRGVRVSLRSPRPPLHPSTCSAGAGGLWMPFHCNDPRIDRWASETLDELLRFSSSSYRFEDGDDDDDNKNATVHRPLVEIVTEVVLKRTDDKAIPGWTTNERLDFRRHDIDALLVEGAARRLRPFLPGGKTGRAWKEAGYERAWTFRTPIVDAPRMLMSMLEEVRRHPLADVDVDTGVYYKTLQGVIDDARSLGCDAVVNCTGLGSGELCNDGSMVGDRGVLLLFDRRTCRRVGGLNANDAAVMITEPPFGSETEPCYIIPRGGTLVVGGTYLEGDVEPHIRPSERERMLRIARDIFGIDTDASKPVGEWVGFRPYRPAVRLEMDNAAGTDGGEEVRVVHNYGHGGSGWTVCVGAAREAASLLVPE